jgi:hypothetical protein
VRVRFSFFVFALTREECIAIPDASKIPLFSVTTGSLVRCVPCFSFLAVRNGEAITTNQGDGDVVQKLSSKLCAWVQFSHVSTRFVTLQCFLDTRHVAAPLKRYIELYLETVFQTHIAENGVVNDYRDVIARLNAEAIDFSSDCGVQGGGNFACGAFSEYVTLSLKFPLGSYHRALAWLSDILYRTVFDVERLKVAAAKLCNDIPSSKRSGNKVCDAESNRLLYVDESSHVSCNFIEQAAFLASIASR